MDDHGISWYMGVSINGGTPKWMVYFMENPIKMDDLGVPPFMETPISWIPSDFPTAGRRSPSEVASRPSGRREVATWSGYEAPGEVMV